MRRAGYAYVWSMPRKRTVIVFGQCAVGDLDELEPIFEEVGTELRLYEPDLREDAKWRKRYAQKGYRAIDYRTPVRIEAMEDGWKVEDTENYIVVYNTSDQPLVRRIVKDLENIRKKYIELFPPSGPIEAVSTVRVCSGMSEYHSYGGPPGAAGYWYDVTEELVLDIEGKYDYWYQLPSGSLVLEPGEARELTITVTPPGNSPSLNVRDSRLNVTLSSDPTSSFRLDLPLSVTEVRQGGTDGGGEEDGFSIPGPGLLAAFAALGAGLRLRRHR